jgi:hypothetical protein
LTGGEVVDYWHAVPPLAVDSKPLAHPQDRWAGILNIPAKFEVADSAEAEPVRARRQSV